MSTPISSRISGRAHHTPGPLAYPLLTQTIVKMLMASDLSLRGRFAPVAISGRQCRFVPAAVKMARADCVCSGAHCAAVGGFAALRMRRALYGR